MKFKPYHFLLLSLLIPFAVKAQSPEPALGKAYYKFTYQYDTIRPQLVKTETFVLLLSKGASEYKSYDRMRQDSEMRATYKRTGAVAPPSGPRATGDEFFYFFSPRKYYVHSKILGDYLVDKEYDELNWKVTSETKTIEKIKCQKATTSYKGRNYTAWFTTSLPFHAGPWKLHGLPGLIVSAYDQTGRIRFDFAGFQKVSAADEQVAIPDKASKISWADYQKIAKAYENDPKGALEKRFGAKVTVNAPMLHRNVLAPNPAINFPMEVPSAK